MNMINSRKNRYRAGTIIFSAIALLLIYFFSLQGEVTIESDINDRFQIYWSSGATPFSESNSRTEYPSEYHNNRTYTKFLTDNLSNVENIRIDPLSYRGQFTIFSVTISQPGYKTLSFSTQRELGHIFPTNHISDFRITEDGIAAISIGIDPQMILAFQPKLSFFWFLSRLVVSFFVVIIVYYVVLIFSRHKNLSAVAIFFVNIMIVCFLVLSWWTSKDNTLFQNGRWAIGKDEGKFVFQTYEFMSAPISRSGLSLTANMGFQEITYRKHEGVNRRLEQLSCQVSIGPQAYIWIELEKNGLQMLGVRVSRNSEYKSGFYTYSSSGKLIDKKLIDISEEVFSPSDQIVLTRHNGIWTLLLNDRPLATNSDIGTANSTFGFRGCTAGRQLYLRNIEMTFADPVTDKRWIEIEDFGPSASKKNSTPWIFLFTCIVLLIKVVRDEVLTRFLRSDKQYRFRLFSQLTLFFPATIALLYFSGDYIYATPLSFLVAELLLVIGFALFFKDKDLHCGSNGWLPVLYIIFVFLITGMSFFVNDTIVQSSQKVFNKNLSRIDPQIYITTPQAPPTKEPYVTSKSIVIKAGQPFFVPGVFREQILSFDFSLPEQTTLDIVFQQQGFLTRGDPYGEVIPLQRRLLRLSTKSGVVSGFSTKTGVRSAPFLKINGELFVDTNNSVSITVTDKRVKLILNGVSTDLNQLGLLGYGETGFLTYENSVFLTSVSVTPTELKLVSDNRIFLFMFLVPFVFAFLLFFLFRLAGPIAFYPTVILALCAYYPIVVLLSASMFLPSGSLYFLSEGRLGWLFLMTIAVTINLFYILIYTKRQIIFPALYANVLSVFVIVAVAGYIYVILPDENPIKLKFSHNTIAPGDIAHAAQQNHVPWYADNSLIGTNIWVWKQLFGGEKVVSLAGKNIDTVRIFVIGGSQAWGSGAANSDSTFSKLLENELLGKGLPVQVINAATNAVGLQTITQSNKQLLPVFQPDIIIIDVGTNDSGARRMIQGIKNQQRFVYERLMDFESFVDFFQEQNVRVILNLEAMCAESYEGFSPDTELYEGLRKIAEDKEVSVIVPSIITEQIEKDYLLWWDIAHLTPYGHQLMAELLLPETEKMVNEVLEDRISGEAL